MAGQPKPTFYVAVGLVVLANRAYGGRMLRAASA